jgi:hypothetical protein
MLAMKKCSGTGKIQGDLDISIMPLYTKNCLPHLKCSVDTMQVLLETFFITSKIRKIFQVAKVIARPLCVCVCVCVRAHTCVCVKQEENLAVKETYTLKNVTVRRFI